MGNPPRITWRGGQLRAIKKRHFKYFNIAKTTDIELMAVGQARKEVIEFILMYQELRSLSLRQAVLTIHGRIVPRELPPHLVKAVRVANARSNRIGSITISAGTLFRWIRIYKRSDGDIAALAPVPSKTLYANTNAPFKTK